MSDSESIFFTDEEFLEELKKLGYADVSPEMLEVMKQRVIEDISSGISELGSSDKYTKNSSILEHDDLSLSSLKRSLFQDSSPNGNSFSRSHEVGLRRTASKNLRYSAKTSQIYSSSTNVTDLLSSKPNLPNIYKNYDKYLTDPAKKNDEQFFTEGERLDTSYKSLSSQEERLRASCKSLPQLDGHSQTNKITCRKLPIMKERIERLPEVAKFVDISSGIDSLKIDDSPRMQSLEIDDSPKMQSLGNDGSPEMQSLEIDDSPRMQSLLGDYRKGLINYKLGNRLRQKIKNRAKDSDNDASSKNETSLNSTVSDGKLKRKILRYKDGKPVVTEELVDIPNIYSSCYPSSLTTTNLYSSDLSFQSNSSTGSLVAVSPESTPRSTLSNASTTHASKPHRKKKSDPVAMYNYYKKFWDNFKPPGEKTHQKLRWAVRDKMLDYSL